jgi:hypothetical protein
MSELSHYYEIVEQGIAQIVEDVSTTRRPEVGSWTLYKSDLEIWVDLWEIEQGLRGSKKKLPYFQVMSVLETIPEDVNPLIYKELLEINYKLYGVAFCISANKLLLKVIREAEFLNSEEVYYMILRIGNYATEFAPTIINKYLTKHKPNSAPNTD